VKLTLSSVRQAFGFLSQYRDLLGPGQEVEYNFGRAFHHIGKLPPFHNPPIVSPLLTIDLSMQG